MTMKNNLNYFTDVWAIVVTWNPNTEKFLKAVRLYASQCNVVVVDNGSSQNILSCLLKYDLDIFKLIALDRNEGIATALNIGMRYSLSRNAKYFLLLDQDSEFSTETLSKLLAASTRLSEISGSNVVVGPLPISDVDNKPIGMYQSIDPQLMNDAAIELESIYTSGMLVPSHLGAEEKQLERFFIDYVDTEWCYRIRNTRGAKVFVVPEAKIYHKVGDSELSLKGLRKRALLIHKPIRQYYQLRNAIWMLRLPYIPFFARVKMLLRCCVRVLILMASVPPRATRFKFALCAVWDGLLGRASGWQFLNK